VSRDQITDPKGERPVRPEHKATLSVLAERHCLAKDPSDWGIPESVLHEMAALGLAERVDDTRWVATPEGMRALRSRKARTRP
jgi:hypothetical protein